MVMIILMWLIVCCVIGFALGLFGVLVPGPQWWRKSRSRAAQIMGGSFVVFIIITMISANLVHEQSDVGGPSASPTPSASRESVPTTKIIQEDTAVGTIVRRQEVPPDRRSRSLHVATAMVLWCNWTRIFRRIRW